MKKTLLLSASILIFFTVGAQPYFTDVAISSGVNHRSVRSLLYEPIMGGAAWFDYNNDGFEDLYLTGGINNDVFYRNNGDGSFTDITNTAGFGILGTDVFTNGVAVGDIDNDGYSDVFITTLSNNLNYLFHNNGNGTFTDISVSSDVTTMAGNSFSATFGDYNLDGLLDLYVANWCVEMVLPPDTFPTIQNFLYINNGDLTFTESSHSLGVDDTTACSLGAVFTDYDNDHDMDLLVANDFGYFDGNNENALFQNQYPSNAFNDVSISANANFAMNGMGIAVGDYDENGWLDYLITNMLSPVLMKNNGGSFTNEIVAAGLQNDHCLNQIGTTRPTVSWGCAFFDYDHDSYLDLFISLGDLEYEYPSPALDPNKLYHNNGDGTFTDVSAQSGADDNHVSRAFAYADYDNDGDLDMLVGITDTLNSTRHSFLYRNDAATGNWIKFKMEGTTSNRDGYGARVEVMFNGRKLIREVDGGSSYNSHNSSTVHFGLGTVSTIDSIQIIWPGGATEKYYNVETNRFYTATEGSGININTVGVNKLENIDLQFRVFPNPVSSGSTINFQIKLPKDETASLSIFDSKGSKVAEIFTDSKLKKGENKLEWNSAEFLQPGVYTCKLQASEVICKRIIIF